MEQNLTKWINFIDNKNIIFRFVMVVITTILIIFDIKTGKASNMNYIGTFTIYLMYCFIIYLIFDNIIYLFSPEIIKEEKWKFSKVYGFNNGNNKIDCKVFNFIINNYIKGIVITEDNNINPIINEQDLKDYEENYNYKIIKDKSQIRQCISTADKDIFKNFLQNENFLQIYNLNSIQKKLKRIKLFNRILSNYIMFELLFVFILYLYNLSILSNFADVSILLSFGFLINLFIISKLFLFNELSVLD